MTLFVTAQTSFHHCTFRFITAHFHSSLHISIHHCTFPFITAHFDSSLHISIHHCTFPFITARWNKPWFLLIRMIIVIVNSRFLQRPQKRSPGKSLFKGAYPKENRYNYAEVKIQRVRQGDSQATMVDGVWSWDGERGWEKGDES